MEQYDNQYNENDNKDNSYGDWLQPTTQPAPPTPPTKQTNGLAIASMVMGILSLIACCSPPVQFLFGVIALVLAIVSKKKQPFSGFAIAGLIMGIISLLISIFMFFCIIITGLLLEDPQYAPMFNELFQMYEEMFESMGY